MLKLLFAKPDAQKPVLAKPDAQKPDGKHYDIPDTYDITHFPDDGRYYPMLRGKFLWSGYKDSSTMDTVSSPYQAIECKSIEECIKVIRCHMEWKAPYVIPPNEWRK